MLRDFAGRIKAASARKNSESIQKKIDRAVNNRQFMPERTKSVQRSRKELAIPGEGLCHDCGALYNVMRFEGKCLKCGSRDKKIISGRDFMIRNIMTEIETDEAIYTKSADLHSNTN